MPVRNCVRFQVDGGELVTIPASEWARILEYLWRNRHRWVLAKEMALDLGTIEIHARLSQLRNRFGVEIEDMPGPRRQKLYRLSLTVKVMVEEEEVAEDG